jgi:hypothetical protein
MSYLVTHGTGPVGIAQISDLDSALVEACRLLSQGELDVAIQDGNGKRISGDDLAACCDGEKKPTTDLFRR